MSESPRPRLWYIPTVIVAVIGVATWAYRAHETTKVPDNSSSDQGVRPPARSQLPNIDDSGYSLANKYLLPIKDPQSLTHVRQCYVDAGHRGIRDVQRYRQSRQLTPRDDLEAQLAVAQFHLYEGEYLEAAKELERARLLVDADPSTFGPLRAHVLFIQGVAALRRGETENCVCAHGKSSCIFPIQEAAVHGKKEGSLEAIRHFTQYLREQPYDLGVRWLLNIAYMTLGEYPAKVPPEYLVPIDPFRSEFDIGRFEDVAARLGLNRLNMAGGAIMDDFDNDGHLDLIVSCYDFAQHLSYYHNNGDGTWEDRSKAAGLLEQLGGLYCVQADYNNDGWLDVFVVRGAWLLMPMRPSLLRNNGDGTFVDVTKEAGLEHPMNSQAACWADYDNDGHLDLFVGGETSPNRLYRNKGDGTFANVAIPAGVTGQRQMCKGANWGDFDGDDFPDLVVTHMGAGPHLYRNLRNGAFREVSERLGVTRPTSTFSCWFWDYDNDGWQDVMLNGYDKVLDDIVRSALRMPVQRETTRLYRNLAGKNFQDVTKETDVGVIAAPMGTNFADVDNDGFLDFYYATGDPRYSTLIPNRFFKSVEGKRFADITTSTGTGHLQKGHGVAFGDWDRDGDLDLFVELGGATPGDRFYNALFQNPGQGNNWLNVKLHGRKTNRAAIGARIKAVLDVEPPRTLYRWVTSGSSFGANPLEQMLGLGKATRVKQLEVYWPTSKTTQTFQDLPANQAFEITEFEDKLVQRAYKSMPLPPE